MKSPKTITVSLPLDMVKGIQELAREEQKTVSELVCEALRRYKAQANFQNVMKEGKALVKKKGLKPEDFGGPFEE